MKNLVITILVLALLIVAGYFFLVGLPQVNNTAQNPSGNDQVNITAAAEFTPSFVPGEMSDLVDRVFPTPYAEIAPVDIEAFDAALEGKETLLAADYLLGSEYKVMKVAWYCTSVYLGPWELPGSAVGSANAIEASWFFGASLSDISYSVITGTATTQYLESPSPHTLTTYGAIVVITISEIGVRGPEITWGNERIFSVSEPSGWYELYFIPRELLTGQDLLNEKRVLVTNLAADRVKIESIAPHGSNENLVALYNEFILSLTTPGTADQAHIYDSFMTIFTPMAIEVGFNGIERIELVIPDMPNSIYGWQYLDNDKPVIPTDYPSVYSDSTCPSSEPSEADIDDLELNK